jgi:ketosteroid isomerase-like protein
LDGIIGDMAHDDPTQEPRDAELRDAERRLQAAQLAGDVEELDRLLDDRLIFTLGPDGNCYDKQDDLENHRTRRQTMSRLVEEELTVLVDGRVGVTWFLGSVAGEFAGEPFAARMRYTRTWIHDDDFGWRIVAAHASAV